METIERMLINPESTIREAMLALNENKENGNTHGIVISLNGDGSIRGVLTDGDIRRALLNGVTLDNKVDNILIRDPITVIAKDSLSEMLVEIIKKVRNNPRITSAKVDQIIIVDNQQRLKDVISFYDVWRDSTIQVQTIAVYGMGYVGVTLAAILGDTGLKIVGIEKDMKKLDVLRSGNVYFHEIGLNSIWAYNVKQKNIQIEDKLVGDVNCDVYIICVQTPILGNGEPDFSSIKDVSMEIGKRLKKGDTVILRSTVPVGTCRDIVMPILEKESRLRVGKEVHLAFAPERTVEGKAIHELRNLPQIIGGIDKCCTDKAALLFQEITPTIIRVRTIETAEMIKLVNNSFRDLIFGFSNELSMICEAWSIDSVEVIKAANHEYPRDPVPLPSPGVGGACLNKDAHIFGYIARKKNKEASLSMLARKINIHFPVHLANRVIKFIEEEKSGAINKKIKIFVLGFAFKGEPETSDIRFSTTLDFVVPLLSAGCDVYGYDPVVSQSEIEGHGVKYCSIKDGFVDADVVAIMNNHNSYKDLDIFYFLSLAKKPVMFLDSWHLFEPSEFKKKEGIKYSNLSM